MTPQDLLVRLCPLLAAALVLALSAPALAGGSLYVASHIDAETAQKMPGARSALVYVYGEDGAKVPSGSGSGGWLPGDAIPLEAGEYWVGVGMEEAASNLHRYTVEDGKTTVVETGWVSVATMPPDSQPHVGCTTWFAKLRAFTFDPARGKGELVIDNIDTKPQEFGTLQLHPGTYLVEFHGFSGVVEVQGGKDFRLPTGYYGPTLSTEAYLIARKGDDPRRQGLAVCNDEAMHVLAGDFFVHRMERLDDGARVEWVTDPVSIAAEGNHGYTELKADVAPGTVRKPDSDDGRAITAGEVEALAGWGKKKNDFDDLEMFSDPL